VLEGNFPPPPNEAEEYDEIKRALDNPIGSKPLRVLAKPGAKTVIMCSDITRPCPTYKMLPILLDELNAAGVRDADITMLFGMGIHRPHTDSEREQLAGKDVYSRVRCMDSTGGEYKLVGVSSRGTPYYINAIAVDCDLLICVGNIEYHYFAGYSGGAKAVLPGAANNVTINHNHGMQIMDGCRAGLLEGNPVREDIDEITRFVKIDFLLNVVLDENKHILRAFAGDCKKAHREGCRYLDTIYSKPISALADVVVACCGGYPKDINMYQAQKALDNASYAVKTGGVIIWIGRCAEGYGEDTFEAWVNESVSPESLVERIKKEFVLGGHKAAAIGRVLCRAKVDFVTDMDGRQVEKLYMRHRGKEGLQPLIDKLIKDSGGAATFYIIPQAGSILPKMR
jgi:nickel-dependent lactate racemase